MKLHKSLYFALAIIGMSNARAQEKIQNITVNNNSSYELYVGLNNETDKKTMHYLGGYYPTAYVPMRIMLDANGNELVKMKVTAYTQQESRGSYRDKRLASKTIYLNAPKGTFEKLQEIGINFSKVFTLERDGKFTLKFSPKKLPITVR